MERGSAKYPNVPSPLKNILASKTTDPTHRESMPASLVTKTSARGDLIEINVKASNRPKKNGIKLSKGNLGMGIDYDSIDSHIKI